MGVITAIVVVAAAAAGAAYLKGQAAKKAGAAQKKALAQQEAILQKKLDPAALNRLAQTIDRERLLNRRKLQEETDPELAKLRQLGKDELLKEFSRDDNTRQSTQLANQLFSENQKPDARMEALKDSIINKASEDLAKGAELPAEFQAELVRSGLSVGAGAGIGVSRNAVGGVTSRLLGSAGIQLEQQRVAEAQQLTNTAQNLTTSRANILSSIFPTIKAVEDAKLARAAGAFQLGESTIPQSGISGTDAVNLRVAQQNAMVAARGKKGEINAQLAIAQGNTNAAYVQAAGSAVSGVAGAYGGGGGGGAGMMGGGGGGGAPAGGGGGAAYVPAQAQLNYDAYGVQRASNVGSVPMVNQTGSKANMIFNPATGVYEDVGWPGARTPRQQALFDSISRGY